jgi:AraC-like DNA-binding protein
MTEDIEDKLPPIKNMRPIHQKYGLWICKFCRAKSTPPVKPENLPFRSFEFYDLSHMIDGDGWYCSKDEKTKEVVPGNGILVSPGYLQKYGGLNKNYIEDAISFCGPIADYMFNAGIIKNGVLKIGNARSLLSIIELASDNTEDSQLKANIALQNLLIELFFENKKQISSSKDVIFEQLIYEIRKKPEKWWTIESMAEYCNLSKTQFNRIFKIKSGMTPKNYIDNLKMNIAAEKLSSSDKTIREISEELGYVDQFHFSRRFKQLKEYSPQTYRDLFSR